MTSELPTPVQLADFLKTSRLSDYPDVLHNSIGWLFLHGNQNDHARAHRIMCTYDIPWEEIVVMSFLVAERFDSGDLSRNDPRIEAANIAVGRSSSEGSLGPKRQ